MKVSSEQITRLKSEISQLESKLHKKKIELASLTNIDLDKNLSILSNNSSPDEKIKLFRSLFRGREDVFALRFESKKTGKPEYHMKYIVQIVRKGY